MRDHYQEAYWQAREALRPVDVQGLVAMHLRHCDDRLFNVLLVPSLASVSHSREEYDRLAESISLFVSDRSKTWHGSVAAIPNAKRGG